MGLFWNIRWKSLLLAGSFVVDKCTLPCIYNENTHIWKMTHFDEGQLEVNWHSCGGHLWQKWLEPPSPAVHSCCVSILFCPLLTSPQYLFHTFARGDAKNVPLHRWWHIRDSYCNITRSYSELSRHSPPVRVPQAYHLHLMNGLDWIGRQGWGAEEGEWEERRGGWGGLRGEPGHHAA